MSTDVLPRPTPPFGGAAELFEGDEAIDVGTDTGSPVGPYPHNFEYADPHRVGHPDPTQ